VHESKEHQVYLERFWKEKSLEIFLKNFSLNLKRRRFLFFFAQVSAQFLLLYDDNVNNSITMATISNLLHK